jgi:hypothetical protein
MPGDLLHPGTFSYAAADQRALFRNFAQTQLSREAIRDFANKCGLLGDPYSSMGSVRVYGRELHAPRRDGGLHIVYGEALDVWQDEIKLMREAVDLWDACWGKNAASDRFVWLKKAGGRREATLRYHCCGDPIATSPESWATSIGHPAFGDSYSPARDRLSSILAERLSFSISPAVSLAGKSPSEFTKKLQLEAASLGDFLWLQLGLAIVGHKRYMQCKHCLSWFELGPNCRSTKKYCNGGRCKQAAYRRRSSQRS